MAKNIAEIPVTEIVERVKSLSRSPSNSDNKIRGVIQDVYCREIPSKFDWNFLIVSSSFTTIAEYNPGTVSINTGSTTVTFGTALDYSYVTFRYPKIKFSGCDDVYRVDFFSGTSTAGIIPAFRGDQNLSNVSYSVFQEIYPLANDFDRFPKPGGVYYFTGNEKKSLEEVQYRPYIDTYRSNVVTNPEKVRLVESDTAGNQLVELIPAPSQTKNYGYDYFKQLKPLTENTAGTVTSVFAGGQTVVGLGTKFTEATTGDFFRIDNLGTGADSNWYRILGIAHDSSLTLATAFANTTITTSVNYTIARAPEMPSRMHIAIVYGALRALELDQTDQNFAFYHTQYAQVMSDSKRIYVSRPYNQEVTGIHEEYLYRR